MLCMYDKGLSDLRIHVIFTIAFIAKTTTNSKFPLYAKKYLKPSKLKRNKSYSIKSQWSQTFDQLRNFESLLIECLKNGFNQESLNIILWGQKLKLYQKTDIKGIYKQNLRR